MKIKTTAGPHRGSPTIRRRREGHNKLRTEPVPWKASKRREIVLHVRTAFDKGVKEASRAEDSLS